MSVVTEIRCDSCSKLARFGTGKNRMTINLARDELHEKGWIVGQYGGLDYCSRCVNEAKKKSVELQPRKKRRL